MVEKIQPVGPSNLLNNMVDVFVNTGNTLVRDMKAPLSAGGVCFIKKIETTAHGRGARGARTSSTRGQKCYVTPDSRGSPNKGGQNQKKPPAFSEAQKRAEVLPNPCILGGPQQRGQNQKSKPMLGVTMMPLVSQSMGL